MYKCLQEFFMKTVPDTSLYETSDLIMQLEFITLKQYLCLRQWKNYHYNKKKKHCNIRVDVFYAYKCRDWRVSQTGCLSLRIQTTTECGLRRGSKGIDITLSRVFLLNYRLIKCRYNKAQTCNLVDYSSPFLYIRKIFSTIFMKIRLLTTCPICMTSSMGPTEGRLFKVLCELWILILTFTRWKNLFKSSSKESSSLSQ